MTLAVTKSSQYTDATASPVVRVPGADWDAKLRMSRGTLVLTASGTGTASIIKLPAGRKLIYPHLSVWSAPDGAASSDINVGLGAYHNPASSGDDRDAVVADIDALCVDGDLAGGPTENKVFTGVKSPVLVDSDDDVDVTITIDTGNGLTGTYEICVAYAMAR
jgi:hypothetical protein